MNNKVINSRLIGILVEERAQCELTPLFALNNGHIELSSAEKQNVAKAAKLLAHTTATVLRQRQISGIVRWCTTQRTLLDLVPTHRFGETPFFRVENSDFQLCE